MREIMMRRARSEENETQNEHCVCRGIGKEIANVALIVTVDFFVVKMKIIIYFNILDFGILYLGN